MNDQNTITACAVVQDHARATVREIERETIKKLASSLADAIVRKHYGVVEIARVPHRLATEYRLELAVVPRDLYVELLRQKERADKLAAEVTLQALRNKELCEKARRYDKVAALQREVAAKLDDIDALCEDDLEDANEF
jgi:hypothetical protein